MRLDTRDEEHIWCPVRVINAKSNNTIKVRFEGWGPEYNETISWTSERLKPLYTFTKSVKCLVDLLEMKPGVPKQHELVSPNTKKAYSNLWPCKVQFRMPHPFVEGQADKDECLNAKEFLKEEPNVFVQPYSMVSLPDYVRDMLDRDGGIWLDAKRLRLWSDDPAVLGVFPEGFERALEMARKDDETVGILPASAIEKGSLLRDIYRVNSRNGSDVTDGSIQFTPVQIYKLAHLSSQE